MTLAAGGTGAPQSGSPIATFAIARRTGVKESCIFVIFFVADSFSNRTIFPAQFRLSISPSIYSVNADHKKYVARDRDSIYA